MSTASLSIVIPAYNEEQRIIRTLDAAVEHLAPRSDWEILVVDDGSRDGTIQVVRAFAEKNPRVRLLELGNNRGKGAAVRAGMLQAKHLRVLFMDADLATPMNQLELLEAELERGADVAIGSRGAPESQVRRSQGFFRENLGKTFNLIVRAVAVGGIYDTQCGFKLLTREATQKIFSQSVVDRFAFDVEMLLIAREEGLRIAEVPVAWFHVPNSRVSPVRDGLQMLFDVARIRAQRQLRKRGL
jgi:dolichyl-phosphate beta-glucosyltransferase